MFSFKVLVENSWKWKEQTWLAVIFKGVFRTLSYICDETFGENNQQLIKSFHDNIGVGHTILNVFVTLLSKEVANMFTEKPWFFLFNFTVQLWMCFIRRYVFT